MTSWKIRTAIIVTVSISCAIVVGTLPALVVLFSGSLVCELPFGVYICHNIIFLFSLALFATLLMSGADYTDFVNRRLDRVGVTTYYDSGQPITSEFTIGFYAKDPETPILIVKGETLWGEIDWLDDDHLKLALVGDERASFEDPVTQVGTIHIRYVFCHSREPLLRPRGFIEIKSAPPRSRIAPSLARDDAEMTRADMRGLCVHA